MNVALDTALREWAGVIGPEHVVTESAPLRAAVSGTFATLHRVPAILRPASRGEVQSCMRIANRFRIPIYPISTGKNWGYGSKVPSSDGCVLMDLGRMNRIVDFSEELAYVTLEPGVTQAQLYSFLRERGSKLWMDATGASPACSVIGNTVERGFGHTPYGDHFAHSCALEVVLPDGETIETGFARYDSAHAAPTYRWGAGPTLDGLFSQSNFGIVTRMTVWLMPEPEYFQAYYFSTETEEGLREVIDALRPLRLNGTIRSASHIANDYKVLSALQQYPWERTHEQTPLERPQMEQFRRELKIGAWNGSGALYGTKAQVKEARRLIRKALKGKTSRLQFLDDRKLALATRFAKLYQYISGLNLTRTLAVLKPVYGLMKGIPTDHPLESTYWRKRFAPPAQMDPDRDGYGLLWCSPVAPTDGGHARHLTGLASGIMLSHGFEPSISLTLITDRTLACILSITYDREVAGEDERAMNCYQELLRVMAENGYYSYRLGIGGMSFACQDGGYTQTLQRLKQAFDPNGILAPGRYVPAEAAVGPRALAAHG